MDPTPATIASGQTPIVIDWDYNNVAQTAALEGKVDWKVVVPANEVVAAYYNEAINIDAPHPAAARLWKEFVFSAEGQNIWLKGAARPVLIDMMTTDGTVDDGGTCDAAGRRGDTGRAHPGAARSRAGRTCSPTGIKRFSDPKL